MSSNIYESFSMHGMYCRGQDGGQWEERMVDIYESAGTSTEHHVPPETAANQRPPPGVLKNVLRAAVVVLVLLCVLLGVGLLVLSTRSVSVPPSGRYEELDAKYRLLSRGYCRQGTRGNVSEWRVFECSCYYKSTRKKNWTESRADCRRRGADLVMITSHEEQEFVSWLSEQETFWIGLHARERSVPGELELEWEWEWVDNSRSSYRAWGVNVAVTRPSGGSRGYIGPQGTWNQTDGGSIQRFICEKKVMEHKTET
ncbi:layilin-like isoform X2 [Gasterosteus aculeatus]